jgi:hypothetical protein
MACPYFYPVERLGQNVWPHPARLPLGDGYADRCCAAPAVAFYPPETRLKDACNLGYARTLCDRFPQAAGPADAVRFNVAGDERGVIRIAYILEKDYLPYERGAVEYDRTRRALVGPPSNPILLRQAEAYVESYLRRRPENGGA